MKNTSILLIALATLAATGCRIPAPKVSTSAGPAQPSAAESPEPPATPLLMSGTNYALAPEPDAESGSDADHSHDQRQTPQKTPAAKGKAPAGEHEHPKP